MSNEVPKFNKAGYRPKFNAAPEGLTWPPTWNAIPDDETGIQKFKRKVKEDPYVPGGAALTAVILLAGLRSFGKGPEERFKAQGWMRARVLMQAATVGAFCVGAYFLQESKAKEPKKPVSPF